MLALAVSTAFWQVLVVWIVLSLAQWVSFTTAIGERQRHAPAHLQARVGITGRAIAIASMTAGATGASLLAHVVDAAHALRRHGRRDAARRRRARPAAAARRPARWSPQRAARDCRADSATGAGPGRDAHGVARRRPRRVATLAVPGGNDVTITRQCARRSRFSIVSENTCCAAGEGADVRHGADQDQADVLLAGDARDLAADRAAAQRA